MPHPPPQLPHHTAAKTAGLGTITGNAIDVDHVVMGTDGQVQPIYKDSHSEREGPGMSLGPGWRWLPPGLYRTTESCSLPSVMSDTISLFSVSKTSHLEGKEKPRDSSPAPLPPALLATGLGGPFSVGRCWRGWDRYGEEGGGLGLQERHFEIQ